MESLEAALEQREKIATVGRVDDERRAAVAGAAQQQGEQRSAGKQLRIAECGLRNGRGRSDRGCQARSAMLTQSNPQSAIRNPHSTSCPAPAGSQRADTRLARQPAVV